MNWKRVISRLFVRIFDVIYYITSVLGWDLIPLTIDDVIKPLSLEELAEFKNVDSEPIKLILEGCRKHPESVTGFQRFFMLHMIRDHVKTRAAVRKEIAQNPDILKTPVDGPIVIIGLARSGTTMLQRLLACDPQFLSPMFWEMVVPTPPGRPDNWRETERYKSAVKKSDEMMLGITDNFQTVHHVDPNAYEECLMIIANFFLNVSESVHPDLVEWRNFQINCPKEYLRQTYEYYKMVLQCLFYNSLDGDKRLLLKSPMHALYIETYKEILPNAKFVFTYRHLGTMLASSCSLMKEMTIMQGAAVDHDFIRKQSLELYRRSCQEVVKTFKKSNKEDFITFGYSEMIKEPLAAVRRIYSHFNLELKPEVISKMESHLAENRQNKYGKHKYNMEEYAVSEEELHDNFEEFLEYFKDEPEKLI